MVVHVRERGTPVLVPWVLEQPLNLRDSACKLHPKIPENRQTFTPGAKVSRGWATRNPIKISTYGLSTYTFGYFRFVGIYIIHWASWQINVSINSTLPETSSLHLLSLKQLLKRKLSFSSPINFQAPLLLFSRRVTIYLGNLFINPWPDLRPFLVGFPY